MMGVAAGLVSGCAVLLPPRFSASAFARECAAQGATAVQYIGEMARFVAAASAVSGTAAEREATLRALRVRVALGNGLAPAAWAPFRAALGGGRCRLIEFYGSSEGNVTLFNNTGRPGAVGVVPCFARRLYPLFLARLAVPTAGGAADADVESARAVVVAIGDDDGDDDAGSSAGLEELTLLRDAGTGRCVECAPGEVGQLLGLVDERDPTRRFDGYTDGGASRAKLARGVRRADDVYFCSGTRERARVGARREARGERTERLRLCDPRP
jgi:acyl-CoA synthetase (AMP-forming)/AMP-acid ligase II